MVGSWDKTDGRTDGEGSYLYVSGQGIAWKLDIVSSGGYRAVLCYDCLCVMRGEVIFLVTASVV